MKRHLAFIVGALLLATSVVAFASQQTMPFNPAVHNAENLPAGILYVESGTVDYVDHERVVVNDADYPFNSKMKVFTSDGLKVTKKNIKQGNRVDVFANDRHEAVYIVLK